MEAPNTSRFNSKLAALIAGMVLAAAGLGFSLEQLFASGFKWELAQAGSLIFPVLAFLALASFSTALSLVGGVKSRGGGMALAAVGFGLPFLIPPVPVPLPLVFTLLLPLSVFGGLLILDYSVRFSAKSHAVFAARIFSPAYSRFFLFFVFGLGFLVYFSAQLATPARFKIPAELLDPALNLIVSRVVDQVREQLGTQKFTEEEFIAELEKSGLIQVLEQQFGVTLNPEELSSPEKLSESLRAPLVSQLTQDLEDLLDPYLPFLPLAAAVGVALSLLFLSPLFTYLSVGAFAVLYRILVRSRLVYFTEESRSVRVLKL